MSPRFTLLPVAIGTLALAGCAIAASGPSQAEIAQAQLNKDQEHVGSQSASLRKEGQEGTANPPRPDNVVTDF